MLVYSLRAAAFAAAILPALAAAAPMSLEQALQLAVQRSEGARASRASAESARQLIQPAGELPDPMLSLGIENMPVAGPNRLSLSRDDMTMKRIGLAQEWVSGEKRSLRRAAAAATVDRELVAAGGVLAEARMQTAQAYLDAYYAGEALRLTVQNERHAGEEFEAAKALLRSTTGSSREVLALAAGRGRAEDESAETRQQQRAALVALQRWVGPGADELQKPAIPEPLPETSFVDLHPLVTARKREVEVARREAAVTAANRKPNWTWEVAYGHRSGAPDMLSVGVSIPLPVAPGARQDRETAARLALAEKAEAELAEAVRSAEGEYRALRSDATRLQERIDRYRDGVLVLSQQRTAAALAAYRSNQASLAMLFEARHAELEAQRKLLALNRDLAKVQAQLAFKPLNTRELP